MGTSSVKGGIHIQIENHCFQPGAEVSGSINVMLQETLPPCCLILQLKGIERTHWVEWNFIQKPDGERKFGSKNEEYFDGYHVIINFKYPIYQWNSNVPAGCYTFPFCFVLPYELPGSFTYTHHHARASIEYKIKSKFILRNGKKLKDKTEIYMFEKIQAYSKNILLENNCPLQTCCSDKGTFYLRSRFSQDAFTPDQVASAIIEADNTNGKLNISHLACTLWRTIRLRCVTSTHTNAEKILDIRTRGLAIGEKLIDSNAIFINLDLPSVRHLINMHYSTKGTLIECIYSLESHAILGGCCLCGTGEEPSTEMLMMIHAAYSQRPRLMEPPPGWQPQVFEPVRFEYNPIYDHKNY